MEKDADKEADNMDDWDEEKLKEVVEKKHGSGGNRPTTDIVRGAFKFFVFNIQLACAYYSRFILDLQALLRGSRKVKVWLVLGMSIWSKVHLPTCLTSWFCA